MNIAPRRRASAPALDVPQSAEAADALVRAYGEHANALVAIDAALAEASAALKSDAEAQASRIRTP